MMPKQRVDALREEMKRRGIDAYLIPSTDPHQSEYVPERWQRRPWISGFTGSAGEVLVLKDHAGLWTDGRYYLQAASELRGSGIHLYKSGLPGVSSVEEVLKKKLGKGAKLGLDPQVVTFRKAQGYERTMEELGGSVEWVGENLVDAVREDTPELPQGEIRLQPPKLSGEGTASKIKRVRKAMEGEKVDALVISALDDIAWLYNIRGNDVDFNPVTISYALVTPDKAVLFIDPNKTPVKTRNRLEPRVDVRPYEEFAAALRELGAGAKKVWIDDKVASRWIGDQLEGATLFKQMCPVRKMKSIKNGVEIAGMRAAHERDGVAMVRFLHWLDDSVGREELTEISIADQLESFRREGPNFQGLSFRTISGYREHGAIIHYTVTPKTDIPVKAEGIYLVDSGAQYLDGTTDITRTVLLGRRGTKEQKDRFTRVLKGHIALSQARFPKGTMAPALDTLARKALWDAGLDYGHGTGHGVGAYLCVHEGPRSIGNRPDAGLPIEPGNIFSNEPGYYKDGEYGIRIENLIVAVEAGVSDDGRHFLCFEDLTLCPIDKRLIEPKLLTDVEAKWLNNYHKRVWAVLSPHLDGKAKDWLKEACAKL